MPAHRLLARLLVVLLALATTLIQGHEPKEAGIAQGDPLSPTLLNLLLHLALDTPMVADMIASGELSVDDAVAGQPIGRLGRGDEIASAVLWLCSPGASLVVGVSLPVDGGYTAR